MQQESRRPGFKSWLPHSLVHDPGFNFSEHQFAPLSNGNNDHLPERAFMRTNKCSDENACLVSGTQCRLNKDQASPPSLLLLLVFSGRARPGRHASSEPILLCWTSGSYPTGFVLEIKTVR